MSFDHPAHAVVAALSVPLPIELIVNALRAWLPDGAAVAAGWRDEAVGLRMSTSPPGHPVGQLLKHAFPDGDEARPLLPHQQLHAWDSVDGGARMAVAVELPDSREAAECRSWQELATMLVTAGLDTARAQARIGRLEKSKRLQQALYVIADLAGADLEMPEMLRRIHGVVGSLMYAENCYIVQYDDEKERLRFLYFADQQDMYVADPSQSYSEAEMPDSLTFALLRHGHALRGASRRIQRQLGVAPSPEHGPDSLDWLGVPMRRDGRVCGAIVVQSYDRADCYNDEERALLGYVAQHILTALDRRQAQVRLEQRVESRTLELQRANHELQEEIAERKRAETLQLALFRISELAISSESLDRFYAEVHAVVDELIYARNFYIALLSEQGDSIDFAYSVDEHSRVRPSRKLSNGLTEYVIRRHMALLADRAVIDGLVVRGEVRGYGVKAHSWLGVPLYSDDEVVGAVVVQSYTEGVSFSPHDQRLLAFVAHHIGNGLTRQRGQERLKAVHAGLEQRVDERTTELADANRKLVAQIGERLRAERRLTHQALHDALTGLPNRAHLLERLDDAISRARRGTGPAFAVLFLDLDRFKLVNDSIGHVAGDELLVEVARRIVSVVRADDVVARLGGDEFAILMPCPEGVEGVLELAQRLLGELGRAVWVAGRELFPAGSLGISVWHPRYRSGEELLRDADAAMYRAKAQGRDRSVVFDEAMREEAMRALDLEADLRRAINRRDFLPYYQPIVRLEDGEVIGYEALLRWRHERRGLLTPAEFIALGEESGLIEQVDWLLYEQVIMQLVRGGRKYVSVNVSPRHFRSGDFADRLLELIELHGADPALLRIEITEVALLDDASRTLRILRILREHGVLVQLDDFGTGFSALSYLQRFPISTLKIDRSFVAGLDAESGRHESLALVRAILALAHTLGIEAIGEGVETDRQRTILAELGCRYGQGYLLGRPTQRFH